MQLWHHFFNPPKNNGTNQLTEDFGGCSNFQLPLSIEKVARYYKGKAE